MNDSMHPTGRRASDPSIPALTALGDQFDLVAASIVLERHRKAPVPWVVVLVPTLAVLVMVMALSVQLAPSASALVVRAADKTAARPTARFTMSTAILPGDPSPATPGTVTAAPAFTFATSGVYDDRSGRIQTSVDVTGVLASSGGGSLAGPGLDGPVESVQEGTIVYLRSPAFEQAFHTEWIKVDTSRLDPTSPIPAIGLDGAVVDPTSFLTALRGMADDARVVERVDLDGVPTQHYRGTVDLARVEAQLPPAQRGRLREGWDRLGIVDSTVTMPVDVWVDDDGDVRRVTTQTRVDDTGAVSGGALSGGGSVIVTVDFRDLGVPPPIQIPAPDQVTDVTQLFASGLTTLLGS